MYISTKEYGKKTKEEIFKLTESNINGLSNDEAIKRTKIFGLNEIIKKKKLPLIYKFLSYFKNPLIIILLAASILSAIVGETKNCIIIIVMILFSVVLNFIQEHKSNKAAEKIAKKLSIYCTALRDGKERNIQARYLVPGDIILLSAGDIIPADAVILEGNNFFVNESAFTGESYPVEKSPEENKNIVYFGAPVVSGFAKCIVANIGLNTEFGKIAKQLENTDEENAFEKGIQSFGYLLIKIILSIVSIIFLINVFTHKNVFESLIFSIAVAVGITPELLPMIMSVNMAKGSIKMAKGGVLVKRLDAIPDFGSMDILCTDKTGTLTEDRIALVKYLDVNGKEDRETLKYGFINAKFETGIKSIMDKAILEFKDISLDNIKKVYEIPYDFMRRRVSIIYDENGDKRMVSKGAPEEMFKMCLYYYNGKEILPFNEEEKIKCQQVYDNLSNEGLRVLAVAIKDIEDWRGSFSISDEKDAILIGFLAFLDPPKLSAKETLKFMEEHGIDIKILTGDSPLVTKKICSELGINIKGIIDGETFDIDKLNDKEIAKIANESNIFARFLPNQKNKIITTLRKNGFTVGYLGDGINDAPSLKSADVGISVDNAVDIAKESADIILMKKGLQELMNGVIEGRKTFGNTMKYIMMGLSSNFGNMFSMIGAAIFLPFFPMLPSQILLNNFIYDASQLSIPSDKVDNEYLMKPKHWDIKFIKKFMYVFGSMSSIFDFITFFALYKVFSLYDSPFQTGWFIESLATQTLVIFIIRTRKIPFVQSSPSKPLFFAIIGTVLLALVLPYTFLAGIFNFTPLPLKIILAIFGIVFLYLIVVELIKQFFYKFIYKDEKL